MLFKILKEYLRRITRNYKIYAVSILGMSVAIIASFHIYHFVYKELSVDKFHEKREDIYRVLETPPSSSYRNILTPPPLGNYLKDNLPEVIDFSRVVNNNAPINFTIDGKKIEQDIIYVDASFFELFSFKFIKGSLHAFKENKNSIIISRRKARQLFGEEEAIGKIIESYNVGSSQQMEYTIAGIIEDIPENSTLQSDVLLNLKSHPLVSYTDTHEDKGWRTGFTDLYLYLPNAKDVNGITKKIEDLLFEKAKGNGSGDVDRNNYKYELQRLDTIYFNSFDISNQGKKGSLQFINILVLVGVLTLVLAIFNYVLMNLGLSINRTEEFKMRRYLGGSKLNIYLLLLFESFFNIVVCFILTLLTYPLISGIFRKLLTSNYEFSWYHDKALLSLFLFIILFIGSIMGTLEFILSYKSIFGVGRGKNEKWNSAWFSKRIIVGFQLVLLIGLLISILLISKQVKYIQTKDLGFDKSVVFISPTGLNDVLLNELRSKSYINNLAIGDMLFNEKFNLEDVKIESSRGELKAMLVRGDTNYLDTYGLQLKQGRNIKSNKKPLLSNRFRVGWTPQKTDDLIEVLVNEEFVNKANLKKPLGMVFKSTNINNAVIVGVIKDVYNTPLHSPIYPMIIGYGFNNFPMQFLQVSFDKNRKDELITFLSNLYIQNDITYDDSKKDEILYKVDYEDFYDLELQLKRLLEAFTVIVLFISLLGLVAISLFITESKTKEIGIRKVNGATINEIMLMLNKDFIKWVGIAFVIACPIAYYAMRKWLENFAYKTALSWWVFALAGLFTLVIALLTVSWQTYRAAIRNPVESLRDE